MSTSSADGAGSVSTIVAGLVTMVRPQRVLTICSASAVRALALTLESFSVAASPTLWNLAADPNDCGIDDFVREHRPRFDFVESITGSVFDLPARHLRDIGPFDLAFIESTSVVTDARLLRALWPYIAAGGILAIENSSLPAEANPLWNALLRFRADDVEALTIPAIDDQAGIGLLRKRSGSVPEVNFTDEMVAQTGVPLRFESIGVHDDAPLLDHATSVLHVLADPELRAVLFAIGSGVSTLTALRSHTELPGRAIGKAVARLFALSVVTRVDEHLVVDAGTFESFRTLPRRTPPPTQMSRYSRDRPGFLNSIAQQVSSTSWSSEHQINELCRLFDDDYATLRRELVDTGCLERNPAGSMYRARSGTE